MTKEIQLTQGKVAIVDDKDYEYLLQFKWCTCKRRLLYYARRHIWVPRIGAKTLLMHHAIIGKPPKGFVTDHKDGNGLHNWRENLRFVTNRQNHQNRKNQNSSSKYPGVAWFKPSKKWLSSIYIDGKSKHLGLFADELDAARAYENAVEENGETLIKKSLRT